MSEILDHYQRCFEALRTRAVDDASWLVGMRESAAARFLELGLPTVRLEEWRYTNPAALAQRGFEPASGEPSVPALGDLVADLPDDLATLRQVFVDGHHCAQASASGTEGLQVRALSTLRSAEPDDTLARLGRLSEDAKDNAFAALNSALVEDGAIVTAARNRVVAEPIHVVFATAARDDDSVLSSPRLLVVAEAGSQVCVWLDHVSLGENGGLTNTVVEIECGEGAHVELVVVQREAGARFHVANLFVSQERDSRFASHTFTLSGELVRNDLTVRLAGEGADCTMNGLFLGRGSQRVDNHTLVDHAVPHCTSHELYKGVLGGKSRGVFRGRVVVRPDAQKTNAEQHNANLIVSDGAEVDTKPQLEIYADDVRCSHGSTVGQLDPDALFYLRARGIGEDEARDLLTRAFAEALLEALPREIDREAGRALLAPALHEVAMGGEDR